MMNIEVGTQLDKIVILVYFALVMGFGAYFGKYSKSTSDYFFGGRRFCLLYTSPSPRDQRGGRMQTSE